MRAKRARARDIWYGKAANKYRHKCSETALTVEYDIGEAIIKWPYDTNLFSWLTYDDHFSFSSLFFCFSCPWYLAEPRVKKNPHLELHWAAHSSISHGQTKSPCFFPFVFFFARLIYVCRWPVCFSAGNCFPIKIRKFDWKMHNHGNYFRQWFHYKSSWRKCLHKSFYHPYVSFVVCC